jgi:hypothetical protein
VTKEEHVYGHSIYLLDFVNRFGDEGGFALILDNLRNENTSSKMIASYLKVVKAATKVFPSEFKMQYLDELKALLNARLQKHIEDDSKGVDLASEIETLKNFMAYSRDIPTVCSFVILFSHFLNWLQDNVHGEVNDNIGEHDVVQPGDLPDQAQPGE